MFPQQIAYLEQQLCIRRRSALQTYRHPTKLTEEATRRGREGGWGVTTNSVCNLGKLCNNEATFAPQNTALFMDAFSVDDDRTKGEAGKSGKNATNLWNMQDIDMKIGEKNGKWIINWALDANVERSDNVSGGEREKIDSERLFSCAVGNWEVYSKEIRWVIFSLFLRIKFDLPAMNSRYKFERDNAGRTLESMADI